jgi:hypothetical protein
VIKSLTVDVLAHLELVERVGTLLQQNLHHGQVTPSTRQAANKYTIN